DLGVDQNGGCGRDAPQSTVVYTRNASRFWYVVPGDPSRRREERDRNREAEKDFGQARVRGRDGRRQEEDHGQAAEHSLRNNRRERRDAEPAHPAARFLQPE